LKQQSAAHRKVGFTQAWHVMVTHPGSDAWPADFLLMILSINQPFIDKNKTAEVAAARCIW
jgi:hypothetical protein